MGNYISSGSAEQAYFGDFVIVFDEFCKHWHNEGMDDPSINIKEARRIIRDAQRALDVRGFLYWNELRHLFGTSLDVHDGNKAGWCEMLDDTKIRWTMCKCADGTLIFNFDCHGDIRPFTQYESSVQAKTVVNKKWEDDADPFTSFTVLDEIAHCYEVYGAYPHAFTAKVADMLRQNNVLGYVTEEKFN